MAARLLNQFPAPTPAAGSNGLKYLDQRNLTTPTGSIPAIGRAQVTIDDDVRFDQYLGRLDHALRGWRPAVAALDCGPPARRGRHELGTGHAWPRASGEPRARSTGFFGNLNAGYTNVFGRAVNEIHTSPTRFPTPGAARQTPSCRPVTITGITAPFGDVFIDQSRLRTLELRDILTLDRGKHAIRVGFEVAADHQGVEPRPGRRPARSHSTASPTLQPIGPSGRR